MPSKDLHSKPFGETTLTKLGIFEKYAEAWVPVFVMRGAERICIYDFFAGTGYDKNGVPGSPIRLLIVLNKFIGLIFQKKVQVDIYLNEFRKRKYITLEQSVQKFLADNPDLDRAINIQVSSEGFDTSFTKHYNNIQRYPALILADQNGLKFANEKYLLALEKTEQTDFLYFLSSSFIRRFGDTEEFKQSLGIDLKQIKESPYKFIHESLLKALRERLPDDTELRLYPFSIKRGANVYGIIFGAKHPRAVEKFLDVAWSINEVNGTANFDIDDDLSKAQLSMFGSQQMTKREHFEHCLEHTLCEQKELTNHEIYHLTLELGHPRKHAHECLIRLKRDGKVKFQRRSPLITFDAIKKNDTINIEYVI